MCELRETHPALPCGLGYETCALIATMFHLDAGREGEVCTPRLPVEGITSLGNAAEAYPLVSIPEVFVNRRMCSSPVGFTEIKKI